ncbi:hypothetical protein [Tabrizicola sp.]|uniref:thiolase family protein n=1 Tax=Tabrizicola sp. TaxID=2005166 RepID=UPI0035241EBE
MPVPLPQRKGDPATVDRDEHPRATTTEALAKLRPLLPNGSVTAGNASGVNDGAAALILAFKAATRTHGLRPIARILGGATAGVPPRMRAMGIGSASVSQKSAHQAWPPHSRPKRVPSLRRASVLRPQGKIPSRPCTRPRVSAKRRRGSTVRQKARQDHDHHTETAARGHPLRRRTQALRQLLRDIWSGVTPIGP